MTCSACGDKPKKDKSFTKAVVEINNPGGITLIRKVVVPASMGDDTAVPPVVGKYKNVLLYYEANSKVYLYSSDGIPTQLVNGVTDYEAAVNLPMINDVTLIGNKSAADLKLADAPMVITVANDNTSWSGADTAEDVYNFFLTKGKVNIVFNGGENYAYEVTSAAYIPEEEKMMCTVTVATATTIEDTIEFDGNALFGIMTLYTADKAIDVSQIELQPKLFVTDFTGLDLNYNELSGVPATTYSIGMVKPGEGLNIDNDGTISVIKHVFDTVADMKASTDLVNGDYAQTLGFHTLNDGGGAIYKITNTGTANEMDVIAVGDLYANYTNMNKIIFPEQFGAYGDGTHDDTAAIKIASTYVGILSFNPVSYLVSIDENKGSVLNFVNVDNITIKGNNAKLVLANNSFPNYQLINLIDCKNFDISNIELIGDRIGHTYTAGSTHEWGYGVFVGTDSTSLQSSKNCYGFLNNLKIHDMTGDAICTKNGFATGTIKIFGCDLYKCRRQGISILDSDTVLVENTYIHEIGLAQDGISGTSPTSGIDIEPASGTQSVNYVLVNNTAIEDCYRYSLVNGSDNVTKIEIKNTKLGRPLQLRSNTILDDVELDFVDSANYYASGTDFGTDASKTDFKYSTITLRGSNKQIFNGHHLHVKGVIINDIWGLNNAPKLPPASNIYNSTFEKILITTGDANTTINPSVLNNNVFLSCQFHNSGNALVFTNCTFINCTKYSFNTSTQRTFINCYFDAIPDANMQYKGCFLLDGTPIVDNI